MKQLLFQSKVLCLPSASKNRKKYIDAFGQNGYQIFLLSDIASGSTRIIDEPFPFRVEIPQANLKKIISDKFLILKLFQVQVQESYSKNVFVSKDLIQMPEDLKFEYVFILVQIIVITKFDWKYDVSKDVQ